MNNTKTSSKDDLSALMNESLEAANDKIQKNTTSPKPIISLKIEPKTKRSTIAFHSADLVRIGSILDTLLDGSGKRGTLSDAVKVALALCPLDRTKITKTFEYIQEQDGRRRS